MVAKIAARMIAKRMIAQAVAVEGESIVCAVALPVGGCCNTRLGAALYALVRALLRRATLVSESGLLAPLQILLGLYCLSQKWHRIMQS